MSRRAHPLFACWACCSILLVAANPVLGCDETSPIYRPVLDLFEFTGIITAEGRALAGVEVRCVFADHYARASFGPVEMTDQHGRFQIRSRVERFKLVAVHPDYRREVSGWLTRDEELSIGDRVESVLVLQGTDDEDNETVELRFEPLPSTRSDGDA